MPTLPLLRRWRTSHRLMAALVLLLTLLVAATGWAIINDRRISREVERFGTQDLERLAVLSEIMEHANDVVRKLIVLMAAPREMRVLAYSEIDAANRRLDGAIARLPVYLDGGASHPQYPLLLEALSHFRSAYQATADLIEADDPLAAERQLIEVTDLELSMLISQAGNLDHTAQHEARERLRALQGQLERQSQVLFVLSAVGLTLGVIVALWMHSGVVEPLRAAARAARGFARGDYRHRLPIGIRAPGDEVGAIAEALNGLADEVQRREADLRHRADFDPLTSLPQRVRFVEDHAAPLGLSAGETASVALLCFDVERLKSINNLLGFEAGDAVIIAAGRRAGEAVLPGHVARLGGGTFAVLLPEASEDAVRETVLALRRRLEQPVEWQTHAIDLAVSMGMALAPQHGHGIAELLRRAEQALFEAKRQRGTLVTYSPAIEVERLSHLTMLSELQGALRQGQLQPFLQPKIDLETGRIVGAEVLVRWQHPQRGWVPPAEFIPFAERTGRIAAITRHMLEQGVALLAGPLRHLTLAVNVSVYDLRDPEFAASIDALLRRHGVAPERLQIEITESGLLDSGLEPVHRLEALRRLGVSIAIDDFGTGQSSLAYLQRLPADELKIDRSFVHGVEDNEGRRRLLLAIIQLARSLGFVVTAEGVETHSQRALLQEAGCHLAQGYLIARPMPVSDFIALEREAAAPPACA